MTDMSAAVFVLLLAFQTLPAPATPDQGDAQPAPGNAVVLLSTTAGDITIELFADRAPVSVDNFLKYVEAGFYKGTIFHRVVPGFMIQGGGFTSGMVEKSTRPPILNEATNRLSNVRGTVAMARTQALRSATAQFFINVTDNRGKLDHRGYSPEDFGYAVFGRVLKGMDVVDRIAAMPTRRLAGHSNVPVDDVTVTDVKVLVPAAGRAPLPAGAPGR